MALIVHMLAQAAVAAAPAPPADSGVISYPPAFFEAQAPANAWEMLLRIPGFTPDSGESVRGFQGAAGNVLIDGRRPASKTDSVEDVVKRILPGQVSRIDLIRGGAPGIDMQGKPVIANIIRRASAGFAGVFTNGNNLVHDGRANVGFRLELSGAVGERAWEAFARTGGNNNDELGDGPNVRLAADGGVVRRAFVDSEGDKRDSTFILAYEQPFLGGRIRVNGLWEMEKIKDEEDIRVLAGDPAGPESRDQTVRDIDQEFGLRFDGELGPLGLELIGLHQAGDRETVSRSASPGVLRLFALDRETSETIARGVVKHSFGPSLSAEAGAEGAVNQMDSLTVLARNGVPQALPAANVAIEEKRGELFGRLAWRASPQWTLDVGLRAERSRLTAAGDVVLAKTLSFAKPRLTLSWSPTAATQARMRIEREVGQLEFQDFVASSEFSGVGVTAGNPDLDPEQAWVGEFALERRFAGGAAVVLTVRRYELKDVIDRGPVFTPGGVFDRPTNIGDGTKDEVSVDISLPLDRLGLRRGLVKGQVTRRRSEVTDPTSGELREISELRPVDWTVNFSHDAPRWRLNWGVNVEGGWRETSYRFDSVESVKVKTLVSPFVEWRVRADVTIRVELRNLTRRGVRRTLRTADGRIDDKDLQFGHIYHLRLRKTFGG